MSNEDATVLDGTESANNTVDREDAAIDAALSMIIGCAMIGLAIAVLGFDAGWFVAGIGPIAAVGALLADGWG